MRFSYRYNLIGKYRFKKRFNIYKYNRTLASCSRDNSIRVWDIKRNESKSINSLAHNRKLFIHVFIK